MKNNYFYKKTIIITGASQGIGNAVANFFYSKGSNLILCARNKKRLISSAKKFKTSYDNKIYFEKLDISDDKQINLFYKKTFRKHKKIHVLINNAAILGPKGYSEKLEWKKWKKTIDTNLLGSIYMICKIIPHFKLNNNGKIIQFSGGGSTSPNPYFSPYAVSKTGIVRFIENLSIELKKFNITANLIAPGPVKTNMLREILKAGPNKVGKEYYKKTKKIYRNGGTDLNKIFELVEFLAHKKSDKINGKLISAIWDNWKLFNKKKILKKLKNSDFGTLRRITGKAINIGELDK